MSIDTRQLPHFVAVAEECQFGSALQRLPIPQSPLSNQIRLLEQAQEQRLDAVVLRAPVPGVYIRHRVVAQERIVAALPSDSRLSEKAELSIDDLTDERMVGYPEDSTFSQAIAARLLDHNVRPRYAHRAIETSALILLVAAGIGPALVPESAMSRSLGRGEYRKIIDGPVAQLTISWRTNDQSRLVDHLVSFLNYVIRDMQGDSNR